MGDQAQEEMDSVNDDSIVRWRGLADLAAFLKILADDSDELLELDVVVLVFRNVDLNYDLVKFRYHWRLSLR